MNGWGVFFIILLLAIIVGGGGWIAYTRIRAKRLGLPPPPLNPFASRGDAGGSNYPAPAPGGIRGFFDNQVRKFKNRNNRSAAGAYEESNYNSGTARGRGAGHRLDPDEAWDARVGNEAYYEEQELGLHAPQQGGYGNNVYGAPSPGFVNEPERGRSRTREYDEPSELQGSTRDNPFGDDHATSLRGVSPRPYGEEHAQDTSYGGAAQATKKNAGHPGESPTERRSMFREDM